MKKRLLALSLALVMVLGLFAGCGAKEEPVAEEPAADTEVVEEEVVEEEVEAVDFKAAMVTDVGGINDESFNQSSWDGLEKLHEELGIDVSFIESQKDADYAPNLEKKTDEDVDIIWAIGFLLKDAIREAAEANPDQLYALVDDAFEEDELPNVISVVFNAEESSFLVGIAAAMQTETDHVGFIVGMESPTMDRFRYGYEAGVKSGAKVLGKEIRLDYAVVEAFNDSAKGKAMAQKMYTDGADVIFHAAGASGNGVIEAAKDMDKWVIGVDLDQNHLAPDNVITSGLKNVGNSVYDITKRVMDGEDLGGKVLHMGLAEDGVGIADSSDKHLTQEILDAMKAAEDEIKAGNMVIPFTAEDLAAFEAEHLAA